jgi:hypothetical protein
MVSLAKDKQIHLPYNFRNHVHNYAHRNCCSELIQPFKSGKITASYIQWHMM